MCPSFDPFFIEESIRGLVETGALTGTQGAYRLSREHALTVLETMRHRVGQPHFLLLLGEAYLLADRLADSLEVVGRALTLAREDGERGYEARALRLLGDATARRDPPEHAEGHYREALALAEALGMRPLAAHCHLGLGELYRRTGTRERAREHRTIATVMYREMDMTFWLERAEADQHA